MELVSETGNLFALGLPVYASPMMLSSAQPGRIRLTGLYPQLRPVTRFFMNSQVYCIIKISHHVPLSANHIV